MGINHITLMGTIVRGPEYRMTPSGVATTNFSVAVTRPSRADGSGSDVTDYVRVVTWRNLAEKVNESIKKGDLVVVEGRLTTRSWETPEGQRKKTVDIEASSVEPVRGGGAVPAMAPSGGEEFGGDFDEFEETAPAARRPAPKTAPPPADLDDEIPF